MWHDADAGAPASSGRAEEDAVHVLVLGATGYVGGRLVPELLAAGHRVRCAARTPAKLDARVWRDQVEVLEADVTVRSDMDRACEGVDAVIYLLRAVDGRPDLVDRERAGAVVVRDAAAGASVDRIVYLGELGDASTSTRVEDRQAIGHTLAQGPVPVTELRAGVIIGSGSAWFEMVRHTTELLPLMVIPSWIRTRTQPIAIRDVLRALVDVLTIDATRGQVLELGGPEVMTFRDRMLRYARAAGLRRRIILSVPVVTPRLSALFVGAVTPLPTTVAHQLLDALRDDVVVKDERALELIPFARHTFDEALALTLGRMRVLDVATTWASAGGPDPSDLDDPTMPSPDDPSWAGGVRFEDVRLRRTRVPREYVFDVVRSIGGSHGWFSPRLLWSMRGAVEKLTGGIGAGRGRRHPIELAVGDPVDLWRVDAIEPPSLLRLRAEMRVPGVAWHEYRVLDDGVATILEQRSLFEPRGLWGRAYWFLLAPMHAVLYPRMIRRIVREAESAHQRARSVSLRKDSA
jgi:uncharacterized protein YbjT (DUF2867 family)